MIVVGIDTMVLVYAGIVPSKMADPKLSELSVRAKLLKELGEQFVIADFNPQAAVIAASIWAEHKKLPRDQQYKQRHVLKADAMIVAAAKAAGAKRFYSNDKDCRQLAKLVMDAEGLPDKPRDLGDIFVESDLRAGKEPPPIKRAPQGERGRRPGRRRPPG